MSKKICILLTSLILFGCVSYYEGYEQSYLRTQKNSTYSSGFGGYNYYNSPLRIRGLSRNDFRQMSDNPRGYYNAKFWEGIGHINRFAIHSFLRTLAQ